MSLTQNLSEGKEEQIDLEFKEQGLKLTDKIAVKDAILKLEKKIEA